MKKHIPNAITCCNLISGCIATTLALYGMTPFAFIFIIVGAVFDFFDGMAARLLHVSSPIGKELDSLADVVTFGVAPSAMLFTYLGNFSHAMPRLVDFAAFLMAAFSALRLAKFNLDERQTVGFIGLPTPANALFWSSLIVGWEYEMLVLPSMPVILFVLMLLSCYLLVSEIPMFALKFKTWGWRGNEVKYIFVLSSVALFVCLGVAGVALVHGVTIVVAWYVALSIFVNYRQSPS